MRSLRIRLFLILMAATGAIWLSAVAWIFASSRHQLEHVLDTRLMEAARMVGSLVSGMDPATAGTAMGRLAEPASYERQLSCQIWSLDGRLVARSAGAPESQLTDGGAGFSEHTIRGEPWRIYTVVVPASGVRVMVGDRLGLRETLVRDLVKGLLWPALLVAPLLGVLIWAALGRGLRPLRTAAATIGERDADDMRPLELGNAPMEVRPLVMALNGLFEKVDAARRHEREITAFAAHELRTPLAGLKTQAQVALAAGDAATRERALAAILMAVDRASRLVRQLLAMARLDATIPKGAGTVVPLAELVAEAVAATPSNGVRVEVADFDACCVSDRDALALAVRNLHENAVMHSRPGGTVQWLLGAVDAGVLRLAVEDEGPGIPEDELPKVIDRFFRGRHKSSVGSGLGLAIVDLAIKRCGGTLRLTNRTDHGGLRAEISLPGALPSARHWPASPHPGGASVV